MTEEQQKLLEKLYMEQKLLESNINLLQQRLEILQAYLNNYKSGLSVLRELEKRKEGEEMLMNVGGNIFIRAKLINPNIVTRGIGSNIRIEQSLTEAIKSLEQSVSALEKEYDETSQQYQKMTITLQAASTQLQQLASQMQKPQQQ